MTDATEEPEHPSSEPAPQGIPETAADRDRAPGPVTAAAVLVYILAGLNVLYAVGGFAVGGAGGVVTALVLLALAALMVLLARGLRKGRRGARVVTIVIGAFFMLAGCFGYGMDFNVATFVLFGGFGLAMILLVAVPQSSSDWFRRR
jgi:peptidoglycan/LPS O-acetylase OafA/YrhL